MAKLIYTRQTPTKWEDRTKKSKIEYDTVDNDHYMIQTSISASLSGGVPGAGKESYESGSYADKAINWGFYDCLEKDETPDRKDQFPFTIGHDSNYGNYLSRVLFSLPSNYGKDLKITFELTALRNSATPKETRGFLLMDTKSSYDNNGTLKKRGSRDMHMSIHGYGGGIDYLGDFFYKLNDSWMPSENLANRKDTPIETAEGWIRPTFSSDGKLITFENFKTFTQAELSDGKCILYFLPYDNGFGFNKGVWLQAHAESTRLTIEYKAKISLNLDLDGGAFEDDSSGIGYKDVIEGTTYGTLPGKKVLTKTGYEFEGWSLNGNKITSSSIVPVSTKEAPTTITLKATWVEKTYKASFDKNASSWNANLPPVGNTMSELNWAYKTKNNMPDCTYTRPGYYFVGWSDNIGATAPNIGSTYEMGAEDKTFYAVWAPNKIKIDGNYHTIRIGDNTEDPPIYVPFIYSTEDKKWIPYGEKPK